MTVLRRSTRKALKERARVNPAATEPEIHL